MSAHNVEKKQKRWRHLELVCGIIISIFALLLSSCPIAFGYHYKTRFFPNTFIADVNVSGQTKSEAIRLLTKKFTNVEQKTINLHLVDKTYAFNLSDIGLTYNWRTPLTQTYDSQRAQSMWQDGLILIKNLVARKTTDTQGTISYDETVLSAKLDTLLKDVNKEPVNAQIHVANNQIVIDKEVSGVGVDKALLEKLIKQNIETKISQDNWQSIQLAFQSTALKPTITEASLIPVQAQAQSMAQHNLALTFEDKKYTYNFSNITKWLKFSIINGVSTPSFDNALIAKDMAALAKKIDIKPVTKQISSIDNAVIQEGKDGRGLNQSKAVSDIIAALNSANSVTASNVTTTASQEITIPLLVDVKPFSTKTTLPPFTPGLYPGKYIEVNLTKQMMYLWEGQNKVHEFGVSSGKRSTPTREGTFKIKNKALVGKSYPWIMPYWMAFAQDRWGAWQGIHELPVDMRTGHKEGAGDIGYAVSHGCVRLAIGNAKTVYDWAEVGIPMYVHK